MENFFKYVEYTTSRFCNQNVSSAHTFKLFTGLKDDTEVETVDRCLGLILTNGVQEFSIELNDRYVQKPLSARLFMPRYCLPNILLSASSLTSLRISDCDLPSSLMVDVVKFKSLKLLELEWVNIDEEVIKYRMTNCPLLGELNLNRCFGYKRFCVYGHQSLQKIKIYFYKKVERIDIEAPNLYDVSIIDRQVGEAPFVNLASCKKLTTVLYHATFPSKSKLFPDCLSNLLFIENLNLSLPSNYKSLKLSSSSLRNLVLFTDYGFEEIDMNTPNLLLFQYYFRSNLPALVVRDSLQLKARIECYPKDYVDTLWFQKLCHFLNTKYSFKVLKLQICALSTDLIDVEELKVISPYSLPHELEHLELELTFVSGLSVYDAVVDAVLCCCCPRSLNISAGFENIDFKERNHVIKFTYEKLLQQKDQSQSNIQIVLSSSEANKHFSDLNSLLKTLPNVRQKHIMITFTKELKKLSTELE